MQEHGTTPAGPNPSGLCMCGCGQRTKLATRTEAKYGTVKGQPRSYVRTHSLKHARRGGLERRTTEERFWPRVNKTPTCWIWTGPTWRGYGRFWVENGTRHARAHRYAYELLVGPIPKDLTVDHLCHNRRCVNPEHMELVTLAENTRRSNVRRGQAVA